MSTVSASCVRRCHALVTERIDYQFKKTDIEERTSKGMTLEEAAEDCISNGLYERDGYEVEVDDIIAEHDSELTVDE